MSNPTQTEHSFPPSIGLVLMAAHLAISRKHYSWNPAAYEDFGMASRKHAAKGNRATETSREFYAILDRIYRGETP